LIGDNAEKPTVIARENERRGELSKLGQLSKQSLCPADNVPRVAFPDLPQFGSRWMYDSCGASGSIGSGQQFKFMMGS